MPALKHTHPVARAAAPSAVVNNAQSAPTFIDLFGAPGGMSLGFKLAGMRPVGALDIFGSGITTYRKNFPEIPEENVVRADASRANIVDEFQRKTSLKQGDIDVIIGGPPCQGFSSVGRVKIASLVRNGQRNGRSSNARFVDDKRNHLYKALIKFVYRFMPKAVVIENVAGMLSYRNGRVVEQIKEDLARAGYPNADSQVLNAAEYGVPQFRKRIFFIATRDGAPVTWPTRTHFPRARLNEEPAAGAKEYVTVGDAIDDLPELSLPEKKPQDRGHRAGIREAT